VNKSVTFQFNVKQLENLVDGVIAIGDKNGDKRINFEEFVQAPIVIKLSFVLFDRK
jgi:hypothetical protein